VTDAATMRLAGPVDVQRIARAPQCRPQARLGGTVAGTAGHRTEWPAAGLLGEGRDPSRQLRSARGRKLALALPLPSVEVLLDEFVERVELVSVPDVEASFVPWVVEPVLGEAAEFEFQVAFEFEFEFESALAFEFGRVALELAFELSIVLVGEFVVVAVLCARATPPAMPSVPRAAAVSLRIEFMKVSVKVSVEFVRAHRGRARCGATPMPSTGMAFASARSERSDFRSRKASETGC
jgi:hypothetical protein